MGTQNRFRSRIYKIAFFFLISIVFIWLLVCFYFFRIATDGFNTRGWAVTPEEQLKSNQVDAVRYNQLKKTILKVRSEHGYILDGILLMNPKPSKLTMIICHGIGCSKWNMLPVADIYLDLGFNVLLYDHRAHGESGGDYPSYGYFEKDDLETMVQLVAERLPKNLIAVHGESMGAATILLHAGQNNTRIDIERKAVDFYISDCPYSDMRGQFRYLLKRDYGLPDLLFVDGASAINYIIHGFWFQEVSPVADIQKVTVPVLFIHGMKDTYIPSSNTIDLVKLKKEPRMLYLCPDAGHAESAKICRSEYQGKIIEFMKYWVRWNER